MSDILDNPVVLLICVALVLCGCLYAWAQVGPQVCAAVEYALSPAPAAPAVPLPLTGHARTSHAFQRWNAASIQSHMMNGKCKPYEYECAALDISVMFCEIKPGLSIGLIIGNTVRQIVTGFAASSHYWESRCP